MPRRVKGASGGEAAGTAARSLWPPRAVIYFVYQRSPKNKMSHKIRPPIILVSSIFEDAKVLKIRYISHSLSLEVI